VGLARLDAKVSAVERASSLMPVEVANCSRFAVIHRKATHFAFENLALEHEIPLINAQGRFPDGSLRAHGPIGATGLRREVNVSGDPFRQLQWICLKSESRAIDSTV